MTVYLELTSVVVNLSTEDIVHTCVRTYTRTHIYVYIIHTSIYIYTHMYISIHAQTYIKGGSKLLSFPDSRFYGIVVTHVDCESRTTNCDFEECLYRLRFRFRPFCLLLGLCRTIQSFILPQIFLFVPYSFTVYSIELLESNGF